MVRFKISDTDLIIKFFSSSSGSERQIEIKNGFYNNEQFQFITFTENTVFLESIDNIKVVANNASLVQIEIKGIKQKIYELTGNGDIFISGIDAVPEGKEREILAGLI